MQPFWVVGAKLVTSLVQPLEAEAAAAYPAMPLALAQLPEPQRRPQALAQQVPVWLPQPERRFLLQP